MKSCISCKTELEDFEVDCHSCGQDFACEAAPFLSDISPSREELTESYESWLKRGTDCLKDNSLEESCNALREAINRSRFLDQSREKEIEARKLLGEALEKLGKAPEAADQYRIISQEVDLEPLREHWLQKSQDLLASVSLPFEGLFKTEEFRELLNEEVRYVPLYCSGCRRLLSEAEVYGFRRGLSSDVRCWCGSTSRPLAKEDSRHLLAYKSGQSENNNQRAKAIQIAGHDLAGGKKRSTAVILAVFTGFCGGHKFYLGESTAGWIYLFWFWTLVPFILSLYEALILSQMSIVSFNMTYNLSLILSLTLPEEQKTQDRSDLFSLAPGENEEEPEVVKNGACGKEL